MKFDDYTSRIARHYAAYRPPLHQTILSTCLGQGRSFTKGLDVGCGTGHSARALAQICDHVIALEPSQDMLEYSEAHPKVEYQHFTGVFDFPDRFFDIITFGGSFHYSKSQGLIEELDRLCAPGALVLIYDFDISLDALYSALDIKVQSPNTYDHRANFGALLSNGFAENQCPMRSLQLKISVPDQVHLVLADANAYRAIVQRYGNDDLTQRLRTALDLASRDGTSTFSVQIFCSLYRRMHRL